MFVFVQIRKLNFVQINQLDMQMDKPLHQL